MKTRKSYKQTHDEFFLHPNPMHMIFGYFIIFYHQYG